MTFHWPQIVWLVLVCLRLGIALKEHGQPKRGLENFFTSLCGILLGLFILYSGGFFK